MEATGILAVGESTVALGYIKRRWGLSPRQKMVILLICALAGSSLAGVWLLGTWLDAILTAEFAFIGLGVGVLIIRTLMGPTMRKALAARGQAYEQVLTLRLTADAIIYDLGDLSMTARWACVTDLYRSPKHWVFLVQSSSMVLPRRFFMTPEVERDFIAEAVAMMSESARARSPDAVKFTAA